VNKDNHSVGYLQEHLTLTQATE